MSLRFNHPDVEELECAKKLVMTRRKIILVEKSYEDERKNNVATN